MSDFMKDFTTIPLAPQLTPEDRVITALQSIRLKSVDLITEIDKQIEYIEHCKKR